MSDVVKRVKVERDGKVFKGLAFWSDRTIPGHWVYPNWWDEVGPKDAGRALNRLPLSVPRTAYGVEP